MKYTVGTKLIHIATNIKGAVIENFKLPDDICIEWETGLVSSYDEEFVDEICTRET